MAEYTKKGHRLVHEKDLLFACHARTIGWSKATGFEQTEFVLAKIILLAPCTHAEITNTLRAWLSAYEDEALLAQLDTTVDEALSKIPPAKEGTPSTAPQGGQVN